MTNRRHTNDKEFKYIVGNAVNQPYNYFRGEIFFIYSIFLIFLMRIVSNNGGFAFHWPILKVATDI